MKKYSGSVVLAISMFCLLIPLTGNGQSLSAALGATDLSGLERWNECQRRAMGYLERITAERMQQKLDISTALTAEEKAVWAADIAALAAVTLEQPGFRGPDPNDPNHYLKGLTEAEFHALNSMNQRRQQENNLDCESTIGGFARYSGGAGQASQDEYEARLRADMITPIDLAAIPLEPLPDPFPKTAAELDAERRAAEEASRQAFNNRASNCMDATKGLRLELMADRLQTVLDSSTGLSAQERAEFEADIAATRDAAAKGLEMVDPVDPANPYRVMTRLSVQDQTDIAIQSGQQMAAIMMTCSR
jgi:hypothetical protein